MGYGSKTGWLYKIQWESQVYWKLYGEKAFGLVKKDILSTSSYLKEQGAELLLAFYPWPLNLKDELAFIGGNWPELRYLKQRAKEHHYEDLMVQFAEKNSLKFINIFPEFRKVQDHLLDYYITNDVHFNAKGHELKAKVILRYLQENYSDRFHQ